MYNKGTLHAKENVKLNTQNQDAKLICFVFSHLYFARDMNTL